MSSKDHFGLRVPSSRNPLGRKVDSFLEGLSAAGHRKESLQTRRRIVAMYVQWARSRKLSVAQCGESHVNAFLKRSGIRSRHRVVKERATVRLFLRHVRGQDGVHHTPLRFEPNTIRDPSGDQTGHASRAALNVNRVRIPRSSS